MTSGNDVLDRGTVAALRRAQEHYGSPTFVNQLVELFRANAPGRVDQIREAVARRDAAAIESVAHTLKSNCGMIGATKMAELCARLEEAGGRSAFDDAERVFAEAEAEFPRVLEAVTELRR